LKRFLKTFDRAFEQHVRNLEAVEQDMTTERTRITIETETLLVIRRAKPILAWCPDCRAEVDVITLDSDTLAEPITAAEFQEWLGSSKLHFWSTADGQDQICLASLFRCFELQTAQKICHSDQNPIQELRGEQS
jgi:hypothetical protein